MSEAEQLARAAVFAAWFEFEAAYKMLTNTGSRTPPAHIAALARLKASAEASYFEALAAYAALSDEARGG